MEKHLKRCPWLKLGNPVYVKYHDTEWGVPVHDDKLHFEYLILEGAQAGLSWETVLNKREHYRKLYLNFDPSKVAKFNAKHVSKFLKDPGIIRNRLKVLASINNAKKFLGVQKEFGSFDKYIWSFVKYKPIKNKFKSLKDYKPRTALSDKISEDLKRRGFKFVGSTIIYAHLQATGLVNDHTVDCFRHKS
jgi:DNA-3-methyladenine glycosylase I